MRNFSETLLPRLKGLGSIGPIAVDCGVVPLVHIMAMYLEAHHASIADLRRASVAVIADPMGGGNPA